MVFIRSLMCSAENSDGPVVRKRKIRTSPAALPIAEEILEDHPESQHSISHQEQPQFQEEVDGNFTDHESSSQGNFNESASNQELVTLSYSLMSQLRSMARAEGVSPADIIIELIAEGVTKRAFEESNRPVPSHLMTRTGYVAPDANGNTMQQPLMSHHTNQNAGGQRPRFNGGQQNRNPQNPRFNGNGNGNGGGGQRNGNYNNNNGQQRNNPNVSGNNGNSVNANSRSFEGDTDTRGGFQQPRRHFRK